MRKPSLTMIAIGAVLAVPLAAACAPAQTVSLGVRFGDARRYYRVPHAHYCQADGPYLYCWEPAYRRAASPVVYVYGSPTVVVRGHPGRGHGRDHWRRVERERRRAYERAERSYWRWHDARWHRGRDRVNVRVVWRND